MQIFKTSQLKCKY